LPERFTAGYITPVNSGYVALSESRQLVQLIWFNADYEGDRIAIVDALFMTTISLIEEIVQAV
jgi:hypothetical protein